jgi:glycolate oxidase subunit GlcD
MVTPGVRHHRQLLSDLERLLGPDGLLVDVAARAVYARDASHYRDGRPLAVTLPENADQVAAIVELCVRHRAVMVPRGAGTGLSGGAVTPENAVVVSLARLCELGPIDETTRLVRAEAGVVNEKVDLAAAPRGLRFAPDPSSESSATIGGNVAENAGGPHCLKLGVTVHHLARLHWIDSGGRARATGRGLSCERGFDLLGLLAGSEGRLGLVTAADLRLVPLPPTVTTLLAIFPRLTAATGAVVELLGTGLLPEAIEIVDRAVLLAVEEAFQFGFPTDVEAAMIVELAGVAEAVAEDTARATTLLRTAGAREVREAVDATERAELWKCRKKAFGAVGRLTPDYVNMDVVVPLGDLSSLVRTITAITHEHDVRCVTAFHAGDGNLHPGLMYDERDEEATARAHRAADAIIMAALELGGSITGEHGVGLEKRRFIGRQLDPVTADLMEDVTRIFDPHSLCNPGKALPPEQSAEGRLPTMPGGISFRWDSLTVTAPGDATLAEIQREAFSRGFWIPVGAVGNDEGWPGLGSAGTVADLVNHLVTGPSALGCGTVRDYLLEIWAETGDGREFHAGAPVLKNVAGLDLVHLLCGAGGLLARPLAATFQLKPICPSVALWHCRADNAGADATALSAADLAVLLAELRSWETDQAAPVCVIDGFEVGACGVTILAGGRERAWDLDHKEAVVTGWAAGAGLAVEVNERHPFTALPEIVRHPALPAWARRSGDWTFLARRAVTGSADELKNSAELGSRGDWPSLLATGRVIWQGAPSLLWVPLSHCTAGVGWHADTLYRGGEVTDLPPPVDSVPAQILVGLKDLFDPKGWLGEPAWLERARESSS